MLIDKGVIITLHALNSLYIAMKCSKQPGWVAVRDATLIITTRDLRLDLDSSSET
jgi:hypothetical protein